MAQKFNSLHSNLQNVKISECFTYTAVCIGCPGSSPFACWAIMWLNTALWLVTKCSETNCYLILIAERLIKWQLFYMLSYHVTEYCTVIGPFSIHYREIGWVLVCSQLSKVSIWTSKYPKAICKLIRDVHSYSMNFSWINIHQFHQSYLDVKIMHVAVPGRNQASFCCVFQSHYCVR